MKTIISLLIIMFGFAISNAQIAKIKIYYDANGNRFLRQFTEPRPAPAEQSPNEKDSILTVDAGRDAVNLDVAENDLKVFPNPSNDNFNVVVSESILNKNAELLLIDQLGRQHKRIQIKSLMTTISTKGMGDGVYTIIVQHGIIKTSKKVVKLTN